MGRQSGREAPLQPGQELDEVRGVVARQLLHNDLSGVHIQRGSDRDGAVTDVLELPPAHPPGTGRLVGVLAGTGGHRGFLVHDTTTEHGGQLR